MNTSDSDYPLGVPGIPRSASVADSTANAPSQTQPSSPRTEPAPPLRSDAASPTTSSSADDNGNGTSDGSGGDRPGDSGIGVPRPFALDARPLTEGEMAALKSLQERADREAAEQTLQELLDRQTGFQIPAFLRGPIVLAIFAATAFFALFVVGQVVSVLAQLSNFGEPARIAIISILAVCGLLVLVVIIRLIRLMLKVRTNRQIKVQALAELARRQNWHAMMLAREKLDEAKRQLASYLESYPLDSKSEPLLRSAGLTAAQIADLRRARDMLLNPNYHPGAEAWISEFAARFQSILDTAAQTRYMATSWKVGVSTAVSPYAIIDTSIVLYWSFALVTDLCRIYHLKVDRFSTTLILGKVIANAYIAGNLQHVMNQAGTSVAPELANQLGTLGANLATGIAERAGEGAINVMLIRRLGRSTMFMLQPVATPTRK